MLIQIQDDKARTPVDEKLPFALTDAVCGKSDFLSFSKTKESKLLSYHKEESDP